MAQQGGGSFYDEDDVHQRYTAHREREPDLSPNYVMEEPAVFSEVGEPSGLRILDLGRGDGRFARELLGAGARSYLGIDSSRRMIEAAISNLAGTVGSARLGDIEDIVPRPGSLDLITARLSLHYIADIGRVIMAAAQGLAVGGHLIFTVLHPVITSHDSRPTGPRTNWTVDNYFETGPRRRGWMGSAVTWHNRTIEDYVAAMTGAGLTLTSLRECKPDPDRFKNQLGELA